MPLINPPDALPHLTRTIVETVSRGGGRYDLDRLVPLLAPGALGGDEKRTVRNTITMSRAIGLLTETGGDRTLEVSEAAQGLLTTAGVIPRVAWSRFLRNAIFERHDDERLFEVEGDEEASNAGARDFLRGITWFLAQDAFGPVIDGSRLEQLQRTQLGGSRARWPLVNTERLAPLLRWGIATGLLTEAPDGVRPVPTDAVRDAVKVLGPGRYPIQDLVMSLGRAIPVLWKGRFRDELVGFGGGPDPDPDVDAGGVDSSVAAALLVLEGEGTIVFDRGADADQRLRLAPGTDSSPLIAAVEVSR